MRQTKPAPGGLHRRRRCPCRARRRRVGAAGRGPCRPQEPRPHLDHRLYQAATTATWSTTPSSPSTKTSNRNPRWSRDWSVSADGLVWTFGLRDGLVWHDGAPVTAADCVASIERWGARDGMGQKLMDATAALTVIDDRTFSLTLAEPYGLVLQSLGKISSNVPFMMRSVWRAPTPSSRWRRASAPARSCSRRKNGFRGRRRCMCATRPMSPRRGAEFRRRRQGSRRWTGWSGFTSRTRRRR